MKTTLVTALYDINRENKGDGRTIKEYLGWFEQTLKLKNNMVIFTEKKFEDFVKNHRNDDDTKLIIQDIENIPYYCKKNEAEKIINSDFYKNKMMAPERVECILPMYSLVQYSKFDWLVESFKYFDSDYYFWVDAGISRFFEGMNISFWPNNYSFLKKGKLNIQGNFNTNNFFYNWPGDDEYIWNCNTMMCGGLFGSDKNTIKIFSNLVKEKFNYYLKQNCINNEQILLGILFKNNPELFNLYFNFNGRPLSFLKDLS